MKVSGFIADMGGRDGWVVVSRRTSDVASCYPSFMERCPKELKEVNEPWFRGSMGRVGGGVLALKGGPFEG